MRQILILFLLLPILTFSQSSDKEIAEHYKTKDFDVAIIPKEHEVFNEELRFTPTRSQIDEAENELKENLETMNRGLMNQDGTKHNPIIHEKLRKYKRQYLGFIDENGNKILLINAIWSKSEASEEWLRKYVLVFDGGSHFWNIKYNLTTGELYNLNVNGIS